MQEPDTVFERVADAFITASLTSQREDRETLTSWSSLQEIIDSVSDHNQIMLDSIELVSWDLRQTIEVLMRDPRTTSQDAWITLVNLSFEAVSKRLGI